MKNNKKPFHNGNANESSSDMKKYMSENRAKHAHTDNEKPGKNASQDNYEHLDGRCSKSCKCGKNCTCRK